MLKNIIKFKYIIFTSLLAFAFLPIASFASNNPPKISKGANCEWKDTSYIECDGDDNNGKHKYWMDPTSSAEAGHIVFTPEFASAGERDATVADWGYIHLSEGLLGEGYISTSLTDTNGGYFIKPITEEGVAVDGTQPTADNGKKLCSMSYIEADCIVGFVGGKASTVGTSARDQKLADAKKYVDALKSRYLLDQLCDQQAPLPFITCPIYQGVTDSIAGLIGGTSSSGAREGILNSLLEISPLTTNANGNANILQVINGQLVGVANLIYLAIFVMLIFSSSLPFGFDNYSIKKMLPKFIAAVILTQFSYVICGVIVDFFNLLGSLIPNVVFGLTNGIQNMPNLANGTGSAIQSGLSSVMTVAVLVTPAGQGLIAAGFLLIIILAIVALIALLIGIVFMIIRILMIYIMIILAPIAFAAWVLPGTEKFFNMWWKNYIRLGAMYPMITGLLAISIMLSKIFFAL